MSMGNYLVVWPVGVTVMATTETDVGMDHLTVVPENFEPDRPEAAPGGDRDEE